MMLLYATPLHLAVSASARKFSRSWGFEPYEPFAARNRRARGKRVDVTAAGSC